MTRVGPFSIHFSAAAWAQIGALDGASFDRLQRSLERIALQAAQWGEQPGHPRVDVGVPVVAGSVIAELKIDDFSRTLIVEHLQSFDAQAFAAA